MQGSHWLPVLWGCQPQHRDAQNVRGLSHGSAGLPCSHWQAPSSMPSAKPESVFKTVILAAGHPSTLQPVRFQICSLMSCQGYSIPGASSEVLSPEEASENAPTSGYKNSCLVGCQQPAPVKISDTMSCHSHACLALRGVVQAIECFNLLGGSNEAVGNQE